MLHNLTLCPLFCCISITNINKNLDILIREYEKNEDVNFALSLYRNQIKKYIGESIAMLNGVTDIIISGPNLHDFNVLINNVLQDISFLEIKLKPTPWNYSNSNMQITTKESKISVCLNEIKITEIIYKGTIEYLKEQKAH